MLFIFYLISKLFDDGQVVCAYVRGANEREVCAAGAIENRRNLVLSFFFSLSFLGDRVPLPNVSLKTTDCFCCCRFFFKLWTLERYLLPALQPNIDQAFRPAVCKDPTQPESAGSGRLARAQRDRSGFISWSGLKTMTFIKYRQVLENTKLVSVVLKSGSNVFT